MDKISKWWIAGVGALIVTGALGVGAVMAQEATPSATVTTQETPEAQETPSTDETPDSSTPDDGDDVPSERSGGCGAKGVSAEELAAFLGITEDELRTELEADGATLATVAAAHGQSREALITFLTEQKQASLAERVAAGDLTQEEADAKLAEFTENVDEIVDGSGLGRGFHGPRGDGEESGDGVTPSGATFSRFRS